MNNQEREKLEKLLQKYLADKLTPAEEEFIADWYAQLNQKPPGNTESTEELEQQQHKNWLALSSKLQHFQQGEKRQESKFRIITLSKNYGYWVGAAAVLVLVIGFNLYWFKYPADLSGSSVAVVETRNNTTAVQRVSLPDGSLVWLEPKATIRYPKKFNGPTRDVILNGKSFFVVSRDPLHPFRARGGLVEVKVLGTSFGVDFKADKQAAEVLVRSGKVAVTLDKPDLPAFLDFMIPEKESLQLQLNEQVHFDKSAETLVKHKINPAYWEQQLPKAAKKTFTNTPLNQVIQALEDQHRVAIRMENQQLNNCTLTAFFHTQPIEVKLEMICKSIGADYRLIDDRFIIFGEGCKR